MYRGVTLPVRMRCGIFCITLILLLLPIASRSTPEVDTLSIPLQLSNGLSGRLELLLNQAGGAFSIEPGDESIIYRNDLYRIEVVDRLQQERILKFHMESVSGSPFQLQSLALEAMVPNFNIAGIWSPSDLGTNSIIAAEPSEYFHTVADANYGIPYIAGATASGQNAFAFGLLTQDLSVNMATAPANNGFSVFRIAETVPRVLTAVDEVFFLSREENLNWFQTARQYADWVDAERHYQPFPVGTDAFHPLYDTWYWSGDAVDDQLYADTSRLASQIGMKSFLVDAGWDTETGEYDRWLDGATGNYDPPRSKFTDLVQTFNFMRAANNLSVRLWLQPFAVGRKSTRYNAVQDEHIEIPMGFAGPGWPGNLTWPVALPSTTGMLESVNLCPRLNSTGDYLRELFSEVERRYHPEGYWLDAMEFIPATCAAQHEHDYESFGKGFNASLETIRSTILAHNPNTVVQFRGPYANLNTKPYGNVWQTPDSPGSPEQMRLLTLKMRPFSNGIVFASDQLYWPDNFSEADTAKAAMTVVLSGVPSFGLNVLTASPRTLEIVRSWIDFYEIHKADLISGRFDVFGDFRHPNHFLEGPDRVFAFVRESTDAALPAEHKREIYLLNATDADSLDVNVSAVPDRRYGLTTYDRSMRPTGRTMRSADGLGWMRIQTEVEQGGFLRLTAIPQRIVNEGPKPAPAVDVNPQF
jgi:alpha-galactosidase